MPVVKTFQVIIVSLSLFYHFSRKAGQIVTYEAFSSGFNLIQQLKIVLEQYPDDGQILLVRQTLFSKRLQSQFISD